MSAYDVIVVGLGGMGSAAAYHLAARGQRVLGLEKFTPAHDQGSSHGGSRIIRQSYFEDPAYVPLLLRAYELWEQLAQDSGARCTGSPAGCSSGRPTASPSRAACAPRGSGRCRTRCSTRPRSRRGSRTSRPQPGDIARLRGQGRLRPTGADGPGAHRPRRSAPVPTLRFGEEVREWTETAVRRQGDDRPRHLHRGPAGDLSRRVGAAAARRVRHPDHRRAPGAVLARPDRRHRSRSRTTRSSSTRTPTGSRSTASRPSTDRRRSQGRRSSARARSAHPRPSTAWCIRRRSPRCATGSANCCPRSTDRACTRRPACTPTRPTSTSSSPATRTAPMSRWRAASRGTGSSSCPSSARSWPISR